MRVMCHPRVHEYKCQELFVSERFWGGVAHALLPWLHGIEVPV